MKVKFNNENEFKEWVNDNIGEGVIIAFGEIDTPDEFPCIMTYDFIQHPHLDCADDEEQFDHWIEEGYDSDDIEKFEYDFIYKSDFDR